MSTNQEVNPTLIQPTEVLLPTSPVLPATPLPLTLALPTPVMNMTVMQTDWQRSQLSIEPTRSQIGCVDRELSQLRGFTEIHIHGNNKALSAQIGAQADRNRHRKASRTSWVWTESGSEETSAPRKEVLRAQSA
jgi:hypothetical protein